MSRKLVVAMGILAILAVAGWAYLAYMRPPQSHLWGDEGTYVAMTASLARDGDLVFAETDRDWALERGGDKGVAVILQKTPKGITYSKPLLYPLLGAMPYKILGEHALVVVNVLALAFGLWMAWIYLSRFGSGSRLWLTLLTFAAFAAVPPYLLWRMSETLQIGLTLGGLCLAVGALRSGREEGSSDLLDARWAPFVGGALLGMLIGLRVSNAIIAVVAVLACLLSKKPRRALEVASGTVASAALIAGLSMSMAGATNPYTAQRSSFNAQVGYPVGAMAGGTTEVESGTATGAQASPIARFDQRPATHYPRWSLDSTTIYSAFYFVVGRHTGLLAYFPLAILLVVMSLRKPCRVGWPLLAGALGMAAFYLLYMPNNYFGGSTFVGNRYFLVAYATLLIGLGRLPKPKALLGICAVALLFGASAVLSVRRTAGLDGSSQSHASAGAFRTLPYESTASEIQGHKGRFWSRDYVRFTDAFASVLPRRFLLYSDRPAAELMWVTRLQRPRMLFYVRPNAPGAVLEWSDFLRGGRIPLDSEGSVIEIAPSPSWRWHKFWFRNDETYKARALRMDLSPGEGSASQAEIFYLGDDVKLLRVFARELVEADLVAEAISGGRSTIGVEVRNSSRVSWTSNSVLPVSFGYRLLSENGMVASDRQPLPANVPPGGTVVLQAEVEWPDEAGEYHLLVDLSMHPVLWFEQRLGEPLAETMVTVSAQ